MWDELLATFVLSAVEFYQVMYPKYLNFITHRVLMTTNHLVVGSLYFYIGFWSAINGTR